MNFLDVCGLRFASPKMQILNISSPLIFKHYYFLSLMVHKHRMHSLHERRVINAPQQKVSKNIFAVKYRILNISKCLFIIREKLFVQRFVVCVLCVVCLGLSLGFVVALQLVVVWLPFVVCLFVCGWLSFFLLVFLFMRCCFSLMFLFFFCFCLLLSRVGLCPFNPK